jgi:hypothetical protein
LRIQNHQQHKYHQCNESFYDHPEISRHYDPGTNYLFTRTYHTNISYKHIIQTYHTNISYTHIIQTYRTNISYKHLIHTYTIIW